MKQIHFQDGTSFTPTKIVCVGRNYAKHIEEMKSTATKDPVLFLKPNSSIHPFTEPLPIPTNFGEVHHEIELAVCIGQSATNVTPEQAEQCIAGYGIALDLTLRDVQSEAKKAGLPWAVAKGFDNSCPISEFVNVKVVKDAHNLELELKVNDEIRQQGNTSHMLFRIPKLIAYASRFYTFEPGDIFLTGTPAGVGPLTVGDRIEAKIEHVGAFETIIV